MVFFISQIIRAMPIKKLDETIVFLTTSLPYRQGLRNFLPFLRRQNFSVVVQASRLLYYGKKILLGGGISTGCWDPTASSATSCFLHFGSSLHVHYFEILGPDNTTQTYIVAYLWTNLSRSVWLHERVSHVHHRNYCLSRTPTQ